MAVGQYGSSRESASPSLRNLTARLHCADNGSFAEALWLPGADALLQSQCDSRDWSDWRWAPDEFISPKKASVRDAKKRCCDGREHCSVGQRQGDGIAKCIGGVSPARRWHCDGCRWWAGGGCGQGYSGWRVSSHQVSELEVDEEVVREGRGALEEHDGEGYEAHDRELLDHLVHDPLVRLWHLVVQD